MQTEKTIELIDEETNQKYTYKLEEDVPEEHALIKIIKFTLKVLRFSLYLCVTVLEVFIKLLKRLFLKDYEPFKEVSKKKVGLLDRIAQRNINKEKIKLASEYLARHEYNFERSDQYLMQYKFLQEKLSDISKNKVVLDTEIYRDIFKRVNILVSEAETKALEEGYKHAKRTHYKLKDQDIYEDFIKDKVLRGEGQTNWKDLKLRLELDEDDR
ncbi:hypothetical protein [Intestinibacter sp.]